MKALETEGISNAMWRRRSTVLTLLLCVGTALLSGCGGVKRSVISDPVSPSPKGTSADLRGGWLIDGILPFSNPLPGGPSPFGLALNLDIINGQVTGYGSVQMPCSSEGSFGGAVGGGIRLANAAIAADGTFTITDVLAGNNTRHQVVVQGTVPATVGGSWSGTYTATAPYSSCNGVVPPSQTGTFTAQKIADLNGTFAGHGMLNDSSTAVSFVAALTQGGPESLNSSTTGINSQDVLNGTLQVQGISCFKSGTMKVTSGFPEGGLTGNLAIMQFQMDDGSTVSLDGHESDTTASTLTYVTLLVTGGGCDKTFMSLTTATKQ